MFSKSYLNNVVFSYLNMSSIRSKVGDLDKIVDGNINILCIAETKLDESFPNNQFVYQYNQCIYTGYYRQFGVLIVFVASRIP